ncbi:Uso1/P115-like protein [Pseudoscourfieldia marina]
MNSLLTTLGDVSSKILMGAGADDDDDDGGAEALLERVANSVLAEDRRSALSELRDVVAERVAAQIAVGSIGYPTLLTVLRDESEDLDMVRSALEVLVATLGGGPGSGAGGGGGGGEQNLEGEHEGSPAEQSRRSSAVPQTASVNAEMFTRELGSVSILLRTLEEEDFYVRYHTLQTLNALVPTSAARLQESIMTHPVGMGRLVDMLLEREVIRNEALLLLTGLSRVSEEAQKILVFEGTLERLFNIAREEGAAEGGVVVQDCLELLCNLLRESTPNQMFFRESGFAPQLVSLLNVCSGGGGGGSGGSGGMASSTAASMAPAPVPSDGAADGSPDASAKGASTASDSSRHILPSSHQPAAIAANAQRDSILLVALEAFALLVQAPPFAPNSSGQALKKECACNQPALVKAGALEVVANLAVGRNSGAFLAAVRAAALSCLSLLVRECRVAQDRLGNLEIGDVAATSGATDMDGVFGAAEVAALNNYLGGGSHQSPSAGAGKPALYLVLQRSLFAPARTERAAASGVIRSYCDDNEEGQTLLVTTLTPVAADDVGSESETFGTLLASSLASGDLRQGHRACAVLSFLLANNDITKEKMLRTPIDLTADVAEDAHLLPRVVKSLRRALGDGAKAADTSIGRDAAAVQVSLLRLLYVWMDGCPAAVSAFLASPGHLPLLADVIAGRDTRVGPESAVHVKGLAAAVAGCCVVFNASRTKGAGGGDAAFRADASTVLDVISTRVGVSEFFAVMESLLKVAKTNVHNANVRRTPMPHRRSAAAAPPTLSDVDDGDVDANSIETAITYERSFVESLQTFESACRQAVVDVYARPASTITDAGGDAAAGISDLSAAQAFIRRQASDLNELRLRNASLAEQLSRNHTTSSGPSSSSMLAGTNGSEGGDGGDATPAGGETSALVAAAERRASELSSQLSEAKAQAASSAALSESTNERAAAAEAALAKAEARAAKAEADLQDLAGAYNALEQASFEREAAARSERSSSTAAPPSGGKWYDEGQLDVQIATAKEEAANAARAEAEEEMGDLLVCLGQEEAKVERLREALAERGMTEEQVDEMLCDIGADEEEEDDEEDDEEEES